MHRPLRILLADAHAAFRQPLALVLEREPDVESVSEAGSIAEARGALGPLNTCVMELDFPDGSGLELIPSLLMAHRGIGVLVLTSSEDEALLARVVQAGAAGLLSKHTSLEELLTAIRRVGRGEWLLEPRRRAELGRIGREHASRERETRRQAESLTLREREVLLALAEGLSDKEVAWRLDISVDTVRTHLVHVFSKLDVESRLQAVLFALRHGVARLT